MASSTKNVTPAEVAIVITILAMIGAGTLLYRRDGSPEPPIDVNSRSSRETHFPQNIIVQRQQVIIDAYRTSAQGAADRVLGAINKVRAATDVADPAQVDVLRREVVSALEASHSLQENLISVQRELKHAPMSYKAAAGGFRARADDYSDEKYKVGCLAWAARYEVLAAACPEQQRDVERFLSQVEPTIGFVRETKRLLDDYHLFLSTYVEAEPPKAEVDRYLETLRSYAKKFGVFERESRHFEGREEPSGPPSRPTPTKEIKTPSAETAAPTTIPMEEKLLAEIRELEASKDADPEDLNRRRMIYETLRAGLERISKQEGPLTKTQTDTRFATTPQ